MGCLELCTPSTYPAWDGCSPAGDPPSGAVRSSRFISTPARLCHYSFSWTARIRAGSVPLPSKIRVQAIRRVPSHQLPSRRVYGLANRGQAVQLGRARGWAGGNAASLLRPDSEAIRVIIRLGGGGDPVPAAPAGRQPIRAQADPLVPDARPTASPSPYPGPGQERGRFRRPAAGPQGPAGCDSPLPPPALPDACARTGMADRPNDRL